MTMFIFHFKLLSNLKVFWPNLVKGRCSTTSIDNNFYKEVSNCVLTVYIIKKIVCSSCYVWVIIPNFFSVKTCWRFHPLLLKIHKTLNIRGGNNVALLVSQENNHSVTCICVSLIRLSNFYHRVNFSVF
jgi:hypothetical protein